MPLERGAFIGSYRLLFRLGSGGMGEVWRARDPTTERDVAIKVLGPDAVRDPDRMKRFAMEAKATSALHHPNILSVYEVGESEDGPYIATEYVQGETVRSLLAEGRIPVDRAVDIAAQAAEGVASAHGAGVVHRDLKPENLMVERGGAVKILDFGLAKLLRDSELSGGIGAAAQTATGMVIGTAGYLSPEQLRGGKASERSDVFSLGVVLYEMVTGVNPFQRGNAVETFAAILQEPPQPVDRIVPEAPAELGRVLDRALAKTPEDRYGSAAELARDLRNIASALRGNAAAVLGASGTESPRRRIAWLPATVTVVLVVLFFFVFRGCAPG